MKVLRSWLLPLIFFAALFLLVLGLQAVEGTIIIVDQEGEGDYTTIQEAIDNASAGDEVRVWAGTYQENVVVNKTLSLVGNGSEEVTLSPGTGDNVLKIKGNWCNVSGFLFKGRYQGIHLSRSENCTILNNTFQETKSAGVYDISGFSNKITKNTFSENEGYGIYVKTSKFDEISENVILSNGDGGIRLYSFSESISIFNNSLLDNAGWGIESSNSFRLKIKGNKMTNNSLFIVNGFRETWDDHEIETTNTVNGKPILYYNKAKRVTVAEGSGQIILGNCSDVRIEQQNLSDGQLRILIGHCTNTTIVDSQFINNTYAAFVSESSLTSFSGNLVRDNDQGFYVTIRCDNTSFSNNTFERIENRAIHIWNSDNNTITNNTIADCQDSGIFLDASKGQRQTTANNTISGNSISGNRVGLYCGAILNCNVHDNEFSGNIDYAIDASNTEEVKVNAENNWWGSNSGPYHPTKNSDGKGDTVSDNILFEPWFEQKIKPEAKISTISPNQTRSWRTVLFNASDSSAEDGEVVRYVWSSNLSGEFYNGSENIVKLKMDPGNHSIILKVQNDAGLWSDPVTAELDVWENPKGEMKVSKIALYMAEGENFSHLLKPGQQDSTRVNLSLVNYDEDDEQDRVVLLTWKVEAEIGDDINWNLDFLNPVGGEDAVFFTANDGTEYCKYLVPGNASEVEVKLKIDHAFLETRDNKDQVRFLLRGFDYPLADEDKKSHDLKEMLKLRLEEPRVFDYNLSYLLKDGYEPSLSYDHELEVFCSVLPELNPPIKIYVDDALMALAGETSNLSITVVNQGYSAEIITFTAELDDDDTKVFWEIEAVNYILGTDISLDSGAQAVIYLHITPDSDYSKVPGDESYDLILEAVSDTDPEQMHIFPVEIYVPIRYDPQITVSGVDNKVANTDGTATVFAFKLKNAGSITDQINVHALVAGKSRAGPTNGDWTKVIDLISPIEVAAGETVDLSLDITPAMDNEKIPPGNYDVWVNASSANKASAGSSAQVFVEMPNLYNPVGQLMTTPLEGSIQVGTKGRYRFKVINDGEIFDTYNLGFTITNADGSVVSSVDTPGGWSYTMEDYDTGMELPGNRISLHSGLSQDVLFTLIPPAGLAAGDYTLEFTATSAGPARETARVSATFFLTLPDLWIYPFDIQIVPSTVDENDLVTITAAIHLDGAIDSDITVEFQYRSTLGFKFIAEEKVAFGAGMDILMVSVSWKAVIPHSSVDNIRILVDSENVIPEDDENNNAAYASIKVEVEEDHGGLGEGIFSLPVAGCLFLVGVVIPVLALGFTGKKKRKDTLKQQARKKALGDFRTHKDLHFHTRKELHMRRSNPRIPEASSFKPATKTGSEPRNVEEPGTQILIMEDDESPAPVSGPGLSSLERESGNLGSMPSPVATGTSLSLDMGSSPSSSAGAPGSPCPSCGKEVQSSWKVCQWCAVDLPDNKGDAS